MCKGSGGQDGSLPVVVTVVSLKKTGLLCQLIQVFFFLFLPIPGAV